MAGRYEQVSKEIRDNQTMLSLNTSEGREMMTLVLLSQLSESFAVFLDIYAATHGVAMDFGVKKEHTRPPLGKPAKKNEDTDRIPDSEIPFCG